MNATRIQTLFKTFGKILKLADIGVVNASGVKAHLVNTERQFSAGTDSLNPYAELITFAQPMMRSVQPVTQALDRVPMIAKAAVDNYVRAFGPELLQPAASAPATVLTALKSEMVAQSQTVATSGIFWRYFRDTYNVEFPQSGSPTIGDGLITTVIV